MRPMLPLLAAAALLAPLAARADIIVPREAHDVTVEFTDGRRLDGVDARWDPRRQVLLVTRDGVTLHAAAAEVRAIRDAAGADVTRALLPAPPPAAVAPPDAAPPAADAADAPRRVLKSRPGRGPWSAGSPRRMAPFAAAPPAAEVPREEAAGGAARDGRRFALALGAVGGQGWLSHDAWWAGDEADGRLGLRLRVAATPALYLAAEFTRLTIDDDGTRSGVDHLDAFALALGLRPDVGDRVRAWPFLEVGAGLLRPSSVRDDGAPYARRTRPLLQARAGLMLPVLPRLEVELSAGAALTGEEFGDASLGAEGGLAYGAEVGVSVLLGP